MDNTTKTIIKTMVYAQAFVDAIDQLNGESEFKKKLKQKGLSYHRECDRFLKKAYCGGDTDMNVIALLENCEKEIDRVLEEMVEVVD